jgi:hypothetical protein
MADGTWPFVHLLEGSLLACVSFFSLSVAQDNYLAQTKKINAEGD